MANQRFEALLASEGSGAYLEVPLDVPAVFGRVRAPVVVTVNGHAWRSTVMRYGDRYVLPVNRGNRSAAGIEVGDAVTVGLAADDAPRTVEVPDDLAAALAAAPGGREAFDGFAFTHRREWVEWVTGAKRGRDPRAAGARRRRAGARTRVLTNGRRSRYGR